MCICYLSLTYMYTIWIDASHAMTFTHFSSVLSVQILLRCIFWNTSLNLLWVALILSFSEVHLLQCLCFDPSNIICDWTPRSWSWESYRGFGNRNYVDEPCLNIQRLFSLDSPGTSDWHLCSPMGKRAVWNIQTLRNTARVYKYSLSRFSWLQIEKIMELHILET